MTLGKSQSQESVPEQEETQIVIETEEKQFKVEILEIEEGPSSIILNTNFYWGIGIEGIRKEDGYKIYSVASGYCAKSSGIKPGDIILLVNGIPDYDSIRGDGPKTLLLTIKRESVTLSISVNRCKVYY